MLGLHGLGVLKSSMGKRSKNFKPLKEDIELQVISGSSEEDNLVNDKERSAQLHQQNLMSSFTFASVEDLAKMYPELQLFVRTEKSDSLQTSKKGSAFHNLAQIVIAGSISSDWQKALFVQAVIDTALRNRSGPSFHHKTYSVTTNSAKNLMQKINGSMNI